MRVHAPAQRLLLQQARGSGNDKRSPSCVRGSASLLGYNSKVYPQPHRPANLSLLSAENSTSFLTGLVLEEQSWARTNRRIVCPRHCCQIKLRLC